MHRITHVAKQGSFRKKHLLFLGTFFILLLLAGVLVRELAQPREHTSAVAYSSELNIADASPRGAAAGLVVPASCPSDLHDDPLYLTPCTSNANICGMTNSGTYQCGGVCGAAVPPDSACTCDDTCAASTCVGSTCKNSCNIDIPGTFPGSTLSSTADCTTYAGQYGIPSDATGGTVSFDYNSCTYAVFNVNASGCTTPCIPDSSCTTNTCSGQNCSDSCGNSYAGTKFCGSGPVCGDGIVNVAGEQCDDGGANGSCPSACSPTCTLNTCGAAGCGNGVVDSGEDCDNGISNNGSCPDTCSVSCTNNACGVCAPNTGNVCLWGLFCPDMSVVNHFGTMQCDGTCNATEPNISECNVATFCGDGLCNGTDTCGNCQNDCGICPMCDANQGNICPGASNICGMTGATGTIQCDGSCDAIPPSDALCGATYTIHATAGPGGSIAPSGWVNNIPQGSNQSFTITPNGGFVTSSVLIDGINVGALGSYTFNNITVDHDIVADFIPAVGPAVTISASNVNVAPGGSTVITWTPSNVTSCWGWSGSGNWDGGGGQWKNAAGGNQTIFPFATASYFIECWDNNGLSSGQRSVLVNVSAAPPTPAALHICPSSATVIVGGLPQNLTAWYTPVGTSFISCANTTGAINRTANVAWTSSAPAKATVGINTGTVNGVAAGLTTITANDPVNSVNATAPITITAACVPDNCGNHAAQVSSTCSGASFTITVGCGSPDVSCSGTRSCDYNWKEVAP